MKLWGDYWEKVAEKHLSSHGFKTLDKNFHSRFGELDLVMQKQQTLIFVEVKHRKDSLWQSAADAVTVSKQKKVIKTAQYYLLKHPEMQSLNCRFDVVSITGDKKDFQIDWIEHAFY